MQRRSLGWQLAGVAALLCLQACGDYTADYPALAPTDQLLAQPALPAHAAAAARSPDAITGQLEADRHGLEARAAAARHSAAPTGDLTERARKLRERAAALSQTDASGTPRAAVTTAPADAATNAAPALPATDAPPSAPSNAADNPAPAPSSCPLGKGDCTPAANQ